LEAAEAQDAIQMKQRLEQAEAEAQEFERTAKQHFAEAFDMVVVRVTNKGD
jgi:hypothetical protein